MASLAAQITGSIGIAALPSRQCVSGKAVDAEGCNRAMAARSGVRCRASVENGSHFTQYLQPDSVDNALQVFRDESQGIVCYRTKTGEITCEGIDEGPHFQPSSDNQKTIWLSQLLLASKSEEPLVNGAGI